MLAGAGGAVVNAVSHGAISRGAAVTAPGLTVMAVILFMGAVSGAHLNPAVSIMFWLRGDFPSRRVLGYIVAQLLGATLACLFLAAVFGKVGMLGATEPGPGVHAWQAFLIELVLTAGLREHDPRNGLQGAERRRARGRRRRRLHRARGSVVEPDQRRLDEPRALLRARISCSGTSATTGCTSPARSRAV